MKYKQVNFSNYCDFLHRTSNPLSFGFHEIIDCTLASHMIIKLNEPLFNVLYAKVQRRLFK